MEFPHVILLNPSIAKEIEERTHSKTPIITEFDLLKVSHSDGTKSYVFDGFGPPFENAPDYDIEDTNPISSDSIVSIIGEPLHRGEILSIEGCGNTGKTRLCVKILADALNNQQCHVLYLDSDMNLTPPIFNKMIETMEQTIDPSVEFLRDPRIKPGQTSQDEGGVASESSITICACTDEDRAFDIINEYSLHTKPDLIIIDSLFSMFQHVMSKDAPGVPQIEEFALELKNYAWKANCAIVVTNCLKAPNGAPVTFLGPQYNQLWHSRLLLYTKNGVVATGKLVCSPRLAYRETQFYLSNFTECKETGADSSANEDDDT